MNKIIFSNVNTEILKAAVLHKYLTAIKDEFLLDFQIGSSSDNSFFIEGTAKLIKSKNKNKIMLKPDDPRVQKLGRNFLHTDDLTKEQYFGFFDNLCKILLLYCPGFECNIVAEGKDTPIHIVKKKHWNYFSVPTKTKFATKGD